jgi:hypothetical protein
MACTACSTSLRCPLWWRAGRGRPQAIQPAVATIAAPIAVPASAPVALRKTTSPMTVPPIRPTASNASMPASTANRWEPCSTP